MTRSTSICARTAILAVLLTALLGLAASPAMAHASLTSTSPADGEELDTAPGQVTLELSEPVEVPTGAVRVFDGEGERVEAGEPTGEGTDTVTLPLPDDLGDDSYVVTYRIVSEDGHTIRGAFVFATGDAATPDEALVAQVFAGDGEAVTGAVAAAGRIAVYLGVLVAAGAVAFWLFVARREGAAAARWARRGALLAVAATLVGIPLHGMATAGVGPLGAFAPSVLTDVLGGPVGMAALVRLAALAALLVGVASSRPVRGLAVGGSGVALGSFLIDGHTRTVDPAWLMLGADAVHLTAAAVWLGGLVVLTSTLRRRRLADDPVGAAEVVTRFSTLALAMVVAVSAAGTAMAWTTVREPRALLDTTYGVALLVKVAIVLLVIGLAAYNRRRLVPLVTAAAERGVTGRAVPAGGSGHAPARDASAATAPAQNERLLAVSSQAWRTLGRTVRFEVAGLIAVLAVTGVLVNIQPAAQEAGITGAYQTTATLTGDLDVDLVVDPNRAGPNTVHLYVLDDTGRPARDVEDLRLRLTLPERDLGPIERDPETAGPGHWALYGSEIPLAGDWTVEVVVGIDEFTEETVEIPVTVNP